jgi:acyl carrier protein
MDKSKALEHINAALRTATKDPKVSARPGSDLRAEGILDSLDALVFLMELGTSTGKQFPEKDPEEQGFFKVDKLVEYLLAD